MTPSRLFPSCDGKCVEADAFPASLRAAVVEAVTAVATGESHPPLYAFLVKLHHETLSIPSRVYYNPTLLRSELGNSQGIRRAILACLGTRHHDGYLRQECLAEVLRSDEAWPTPYIIQLAGEYVVEITQDVAAGIVYRDVALLASFAKENPGYLATLQRRVTSYWSCYHRAAYPERNDYPGNKVMAFLRQVLD